MAESRTIYCPECGRRVMQYDGRSKINLTAKCRKCGKLVVYDVESYKTFLRDEPKRTQASGMRFY